MKRFLPYWYTLIGIGFLVIASTFLTPVIGYRAVGFVLLLGVLIVGSVTSIGPTLLAAGLCSLSWNFFFIPPKFTFVVAAPEDVLMFVTFFVVAIIVGVLTTRLKETEKLKRSEELHQILLNSISHELRTPLTVITASATSMCDPEIVKNEQAIETIRDELLNASDRLNRVIENLLDMSRLNSGVLTLKSEWHDLQDIIGVVVSKLKIQLKNHRIHVEVKGSVSLVQMDFRLIEHALTNLILNAAQYSSPDTTIFVRAEIENSKLKISIEDEGPGIPSDSLNLVFEKFYRVPGSPAGGTGLGLSIVKGIIEAHSGTVRAEKNESKGARFVIELPYKKMENLAGAVL
jgi:two-component system sensor histidine kinase KdpD